MKPPASRGALRATAQGRGPRRAAVPAAAAAAAARTIRLDAGGPGEGEAQGQAGGGARGRRRRSGGVPAVRLHRAAVPRGPPGRHHRRRRPGAAGGGCQPPDRRPCTPNCSTSTLHTSVGTGEGEGGNKRDRSLAPSSPQSHLSPPLHPSGRVGRAPPVRPRARALQRERGRFRIEGTAAEVRNRRPQQPRRSSSWMGKLPLRCLQDLFHVCASTPRIPQHREGGEQDGAPGGGGEKVVGGHWRRRLPP